MNNRKMYKKCPKNTVAYMVKPGDTLFKIATRNKTTIEVLLELNPELNTNLLMPGVSMCVPIDSFYPSEPDKPECPPKNCMPEKPECPPKNCMPEKPKCPPKNCMPEKPKCPPMDMMPEMPMCPPPMDMMPEMPMCPPPMGMMPEMPMCPPPMDMMPEMPMCPPPMDMMPEKPICPPMMPFYPEGIRPEKPMCPPNCIYPESSIPNKVSSKNSTSFENLKPDFPYSYATSDLDDMMPEKPMCSPPMSIPPEEAPPANRPLEEMPPVNMPPMNRPPEEMPPVNMPPVNMPPMNRPSEEMPPVNMPPINRPSEEMPPANMPPGIIPPMNMMPEITPKPTFDYRKCPNGMLYTIKSGDTFYNLAKKYDITLYDILNANKNINPYNLQIGQVICIPISETKCSFGSEYIIVRGDTLGSILTKFNISLSDLMYANDNFNPYEFSPGMKLCIPKLVAYDKCPSERTYIIEEGDNLSIISRKADVSQNDLLAFNPNLRPCDFTQKGIRICLPAKATPY